MIYFDNSATTFALPQAAETVRQYLCEDFFNPASGYAPAVQVEREAEAARNRFKGLLGTLEDEVVFTSGGTESNNMAFSGSMQGRRDASHAVCSMVEHPSVYEVVKAYQLGGGSASYAPVDGWGRVNPEGLAGVLRPETGFVSIMHVNNETGAINDLDSLARVIRTYAPHAVFHVDGVQAFLKLHPGKGPWDLYTISGHKFHGPKGIGALFIRKGVRFLGGQLGGDQEHGLRSGTLNMPGVMGMDAAAAVYVEDQAAKALRMRSVKQRLYENLISLPDTVLNGPEPQAGAPHVLNMSFLGVRGEVLVHAVEERGLYVSTGSACSAHKKGKNRVLTAMGVVGERQEGAIRFSFSPFNTMAEADEAAGIIAEQVGFLRRFRRR